MRIVQVIDELYCTPNKKSITSHKNLQLASLTLSLIVYPTIRTEEIRNDIQINLKIEESSIEDGEKSLKELNSNTYSED